MTNEYSLSSWSINHKCHAFNLLHKIEAYYYLTIIHAMLHVTFANKTHNQVHG